MTSESTTRSLVRPAEGRVIAGVAAGLADRHDLSVGWVRFGFVVAALFGGVGVLAYVLGWLVIPSEAEPEAIATRYLGNVDRASSWVGVALIGLGVLLLLGATGVVSGELIWAGALLLVGILLYRGDLDGPRRRPSPPGPPSGTGGSVTGTAPAETDETETGAAPLPGEGEAPPLPPPLPPPAVEVTPTPPPPPRRRPPSLLGRLTVATTLVAVGVLAILDQADLLDPDAVHYAATVLGVVGLGLLVGTWLGRARWLIAIGVLTLPVFLFLSLVDVPWGADWGVQVERPRSSSELPATFRHAGGELTLDLRDVEPADGAETPVAVDMGFGQLVVIVPPDVGVRVAAEVVGGRIELFGSAVEGFRIDHSAAQAGEGGVLVLDLSLGFGELTVVRAST